MSIERYTMDSNRKWRERGDLMPWLSFPVEWEVKCIPPFAGADVRFLVRLKGQPDKTVSVYADFDEALGLYGGEAYWEVYPVDDNNERCDLADSSALLALIARGLNSTEPTEGN